MSKIFDRAANANMTTTLTHSPCNYCQLAPNGAKLANHWQSNHLKCNSVCVNGCTACFQNLTSPNDMQMFKICKQKLQKLKQNNTDGQAPERYRDGWKTQRPRCSAAIWMRLLEVGNVQPTLEKETIWLKKQQRQLQYICNNVRIKRGMYRENTLSVGFNNTEQLKGEEI